VGPQLPLQLHQAPDPGAVDPNIGLDVGGRFADDGEVDTEQLGAALQGSGDRPGQGGVVGFQAGMPGSVDEHAFEQQRDELGVSTTEPTSTTG
jgi:hypothetical protein